MKDDLRSSIVDHLRLPSIDRVSRANEGRIDRLVRAKRLTRVMYRLVFDRASQVRPL